MAGDSEYNERLKLNARVDELNALALAEAIGVFVQETDVRLAAMENRLAAMETLVQNQSQVIGQTLQTAWGNGSTVPDPHPEDTR